MTRDPKSYLPLKPVDLLLLLALADDEQHGYALVQSIAARTDAMVELEPGNLYRLIKRLLGEGLVAESDRRPAPDLDDERRRYYRLTPLGARVAVEESRRLRALIGSPSVRALTRRWAT